jgi:Carboxypeptidase regulatory-like domain
MNQMVTSTLHFDARNGVTLMRPTRPAGLPVLNVLLPGLCCFVLLAGAMSAQSFLGSITGRVIDPSGAVIPHAKVILVQTETAIQHETATNTSGEYLFPDLPSGTYAVTISAPGFRDVRGANLPLTAQQVQRFDAKMEVGMSEQAIDVAAVAPLLNTENAEVDGIVSAKAFHDLPVNDRSVFSFIDLNSFNVQGADGSSYSIGGLRGTSTNFTVDGVNSNSSLYGQQSGPQTELPLDSVREVKLMASNNSAEFPSVATMMVETRSGTNQVHGNAFFETENNALNARSFFAGPKMAGPIRHQFGLSFGGPVVIPKLYNGHNKTFFIFTWEDTKLPGGYYSTANVPTAAMRNGDFSALLAQGIVINDLTTGKPFPGNIIPASRLNPVSLNVQKAEFLPPNFGAPDSYTNNWLGFFPTNQPNNHYVARLDHVFSEHDSVSGRLSIHNSDGFGSQDGPFPSNEYNQYRRTWNAYISETHIFTPTLLNEFRIGFSRDQIIDASIDLGGQFVKQVGLQGINTDNNLTGIPTFNFQNFSALTETYTGFVTSQTNELLDNVTLEKGRHHIKAGVLVRYDNPNQSSPPANGSDFGSFNFTGFVTGFDYADFLLGIPQSSSLAYRAPNSYFRYVQTGVFVQDDFNVSQKLTLNFGLRWEYNQPPVDINNLRFSFNPANGDIVVPTQKQLSEISPYFPSSIPIETAAQAGFPSQSLLRSNWHDFAPRFSFAYRPLSQGTFVVRGGYGIFYAPLISTVVQSFAGGPFGSLAKYTNAITNGQPAFAFPYPFGSDSSIPSESLNPAVSQHLRTPYVQQWNLTLEKQFPGHIVTRAAYRGFRGVEIPYQRDLNMPPPSTNPASQSVFTYPEYYQVSYIEDGGIQKMNALDLAIERTLGTGFIFQSQYTWAKNISDAGDDFEVNATALNTLDPYSRSLDMGNVSYSPRHRWTSAVSYDLPFGSGKRYGSGFAPVLNGIFGGWQLSGIFVLQTGGFLTPVVGGIDPTNNRSITTGQVRADCLGNPNLSNPTPTNWFNESVFAVPADGQYGTCGRGIIVGPGVSNLNLGLRKTFRLSERARFQVRATASDALNHPLFSPPGYYGLVEVISSTNGNQLTGTLGRTDNRGSFGSGYRIIEVGGRIDF